MSSQRDQDRSQQEGDSSQQGRDGSQEEGAPENVGALVCRSCATPLWEDEVDEDGRCPICGKPAVEKKRRYPWHFKVVAVGTTGYIGYRIYQGVTWLAHHL
jgi:ribosomal protein L37E